MQGYKLTFFLEGFGLTAGSDGSYPYLFDEGTNFTALLSVPDIDFGTIHLYPDSCTYILGVPRGLLFSC